MRNLLSRIARSPKQAVAAVLFALAIAAPVTVNAYTGTYTGNGAPQFNIYQDVQGVGDERDFLRVGPKGSGSSQFVNNVDACEGEFDLWVYIHNGSPEGNNGTNFNGTGVAKNTKLNVQVPVGLGSNFSHRAVISADNATTVSDAATLTCRTGKATLSYVAGSAQLYNSKLGTVALPDAVVNGGTSVGYEALNGVMPGCWEYRNWVKLTVKLVKEEEKPAPSYKCEVMSLVKRDDTTEPRDVIANVNYSAINGATFEKVTVNWGDGTAVSESATGKDMTHTYSGDGPYTATATVTFALPNGQKVTHTQVNCAKQVSFTTPEKPVTPVTPTSLPKTGAGSVIGLFAATTAAGAAAHNVISRRRASN
jgi:hypothetical protein